MSARDPEDFIGDPALEPTRLASVELQSTAPYGASWLPSKSLDDLPQGTLLSDRFVLERTLGRGGMGQVYLARDSLLDRSVAVKLIRPLDPRLRDRSLCEAHLRAAFVEEARLGASLTHPAIATVFDFGFHEAEPFIVFEYIGGETLRELIQRRAPIPLEDARLIIGSLAQALDFAHAQHVVHRDLKPENIRATDQGHFKILDLGLAKEFRGEADWSFAGTPAYASPEQAAGLACDGRSDQYALALTAHELLTGYRLFEHSDSRELLRMHRDEKPQSPHRFAPGIPHTVCAALLRAFSKDPNARFDSCEEFAVALGCQVLNVPVAAPQIVGMADVRQMRGSWCSARFRLSRSESGIALALGPDNLWAAYRGDVRFWPLRHMTQISRDRRGKELTLWFESSSGVVEQVFRFTKRAECGEWHRRLDELRSYSTGGVSTQTVPQEVEPVVVMRRPPVMRYQTLGAVEYQNRKRHLADAGLQICAAMMGAGAVVDVQSERLPQWGNTLHRRSGMAIRAVDLTGRCELRSRLFATQAAQLSRWMLILTVVSLVGHVFGLWIVSGERAISNAPRTHEQVKAFGGSLAFSTLVVVFVHALPLVFATLFRWLLWPQLVKPAGLAMLAVGAQHLAFLLGWAAAGLIDGEWAAEAVSVLSLLDPLNVTMLLFACFLCRRGWRMHRDFRQTVRDTGSKVPAYRRIAGHLAFATSILYLFLLVAYNASSQYQHVRSFVAHRHFAEGMAKMQAAPETAEIAFRKALPTLQALADGMLSRPECRHDLAAAYQNLGILLSRRGASVDAEEAFENAVIHYDKLPGEYRVHLQNRAVAYEAFTFLRAVRYSVDGGAKPGTDLQALESAIRRALPLWQELVKIAPSKPMYRHQLALGCNYLALRSIDAGSQSEAESFARQALENLDRLDADFPTFGEGREQRRATQQNWRNWLSQRD